MRVCVAVREAGTWRRRHHVIWTKANSQEELVKTLFEVIQELPASTKKTAAAFESLLIDLVETKLNRLCVPSLKRSKSSEPNTFISINADRVVKYPVHVIDYKIEVGKD